MINLEIHKDIKKASTLPAEFYRSEEIFINCRDKIFKRFWHIAADKEKIKIPGQIYPFILLESFIDEPLLLTRDLEDHIHCLSNVCTHRGNLLAESPEICRTIQCRYHGRRFELDGKFRSMPEMEGAENFPSPSDNLTSLPVGIWKNFVFVSLHPVTTLEEITTTIDNRLEGVLIKEAIFEPALSRDYLIKCNWALYVENYLEGFHIPYVHKG
ncbi:MAG: aromatic ring-hydroxylating dioxygenase subunit alpha, partial [Ignavibacteria bacterium]|nr:aromatic ring-hydroxylating dioxygenase subunit alpha [Ignavibacteria bacterium]